MTPCCIMCQEKYLNEDGTIDKLLFSAALERNVLGVHPKEERAANLSKVFSKLCRCSCHVKGARKACGL